MHFIFPYFIILIAMLQFILQKNGKNFDKMNEAFWRRERQSNDTRKQDISNLDYIEIPKDFPFVDTDISEINIAQNTIKELSTKKILNLTGLSNTDLKLEYGVANLTFLSECDDNFTLLSRTIVSLGQALIDNDYYVEGIRVLEFGIRCRSDITRNYTLLKECYLNAKDYDQIEALKEAASCLDSINKDVILSRLKD